MPIYANGLPGSLGEVAVLRVEVVGEKDQGLRAARRVSALINV